MSITTAPRWWRDKDDSAFFYMKDGPTQTQVFEVKGSVEAADAVAQIAQDYLDLGNAAADQQYKIDRLTTQLEQARLEIDTLRQRFDADDSVVPILAADLEAAINMAIRFAFALGIQANPDPHSIYGTLQALAKKYKMSYQPPSATDMDYKKMILPLDDDLMRLAAADTEEPITIDDGDPNFTHAVSRTPARRQIEREVLRGEVIDREIDREVLHGEVLEPELTDEELTGIETARFDPATGRFVRDQHKNQGVRDWLYGEEDDGDPC